MAVGLGVCTGSGCLREPDANGLLFADAGRADAAEARDATLATSSDAGVVVQLDARASASDPEDVPDGGGLDGPSDAAAPYDAADSDPVAPGVSEAELAPVQTDLLCVLAGRGDTRLPGQEALLFYGTDLGFSYAHEGRLQWLFGDSWSAVDGTPVDPTTPDDDVFASQSLEEYPDGDAVERACASPSGLPIELGTHADGSLATLEVGHALDGFKTPLGGFSTGSHEIGLFFTAKPLGCESDDDCAGLVCDPGLGFWGAEYNTEEGITRACVDGSSLDCLSSTMAEAGGLPRPDTGLCVDPGASIAGPGDVGRLRSVATLLRVGPRGPAPHQYETVPWLTTRFMNPSVATARSLPEAAPAADHDYQPHQGAEALQDTVWIFGRPHFVGLGALGQSAHLYLARTAMPPLDAPGGFVWSPEYFTHLDTQGVPQFSPRERDAAALDLSGPDDARDEVVDVVNQMSVRWVPQLARWLMLYGGSLSSLPNLLGFDCGVLQHFVGGACDDVQPGRRAIYMRTARDPWGPWSAPVEVLAGGDPQDPTALPTQYGPGGVLRHPDCNEDTCAPHDPFVLYNAREYGFLYGANLVPEWTEVSDRGVDLYWNASSWDPYRVVLFKTQLRVEP